MKTRSWKVAAAVLIGLSLSGQVGAQSVSVNKNLGYIKKIDPITDVNISAIYVFEVNDIGGDTGFRVQCSNGGKSDTWISLFGRNEIMPLDEDGESIWPDVIVRLGSDPAFDVPPDDITSVIDDTYEVALIGKTFSRILAGLIAGKKVVVRVDNVNLTRPLTYTFSGQGFTTAWKGVNACK